MEELAESYFHLIDNLITVNRGYREIFSKEKMSGALDYALSYETIRCDVGRRTGKTTYIKSRAERGDLVVVWDWVRANGNFNYAGREFDVASICQICGHRGTELRWDAYRDIYFDESSFMFGKGKEYSEEDAYKRLVNVDITQTFVHLG